MIQAEADETRVAHEAAEWFVRLDCGELSEADRERYERWLEASPAHLEAMQFLNRLSDSLQAQWRGLERDSRHTTRRTH